MDADEDLDYDDIISQNILIRKEDESPDKNRTVEILKKQSENYESQYNRQAALYQMDENPQHFLETSINEQDSMDDESSSEGSEFGDFDPRRSIVEEEDGDSSDSDWEREKCRVKVNKGSFKCDECEKRCATKRGLDLHKRSHVRHKLKSTKAEQPGTEAEEPGAEAEQPGTETEQPGAEAEQQGTEAEQQGTEAEQQGTEAEQLGTEGEEKVD